MSLLQPAYLIHAPAPLAALSQSLESLPPCWTFEQITLANGAKAFLCRHPDWKPQPAPLSPASTLDPNPNPSEPLRTHPNP